LKRPQNTLRLLLCSFLLGGISACAPPAAKVQRNVVLISIDSLCQDRLGIYGNRPQYAPEVAVSPNIDNFAKQAVVFDNAWSTSSWTLPAHMSMLTGLSDRNHAVEADHYRLDPKRKLLTEAFSDGGFQVAGFYSGPYLDPKYGFGRGADVWASAMLSPSELASHINAWVKRRSAAGMPAPSTEEIRGIRDRVSHWDITSPRVNEIGLEWLENRDTEKPFFLMMHYFDAHYDYLPETMQKGLGHKFDPEYQGQLGGENWYFNPAVRAQEPPFKRRISERDLGHIKALYDAEVNYVDQHIGQLLAKLKELNLSDNTVVCIVSDHGDEFFEHGMIGHRSTLFPEVTKIPLLLKVPGEFDDGSRIEKLARIYDLAPSLLDFAGLGKMNAIEGDSLRNLMNGQQEDSRSILQRVPGGPDLRDGWRNSEFAVHRILQIDRQASQRLGELRFQPMLDQGGKAMTWVFDVKNDPHELQPISPKDPRFAQAINAFEKSFLTAEKLWNSIPHSDPQQRLAGNMGAEERAMMEQLGYADQSEQAEGPKLMLGPFPLPSTGL